MKKYLILVSALVITIASCRKVDDSSVFDKSADQRLTAALNAYQSKLSGEKNGWKGMLTTRTGGIYTFYFQFNDSNRVKMLSSFDSLSAVTIKESSYRLKALQQPSLLFDTYSYIHVLADPTPGINGGAAGTGLVSDFEFYFDDSTTTADQIGLVGRFNGSKMVLTRNTAADFTAFNTGQLAGGLMVNKILTYFKRVVINGTDSADLHTGRATVALADATGNLLDATKQSTYYLTLGGLGFSKPLTVGTKTMSGITNMSYNAVTGFITATIGGQPAVIKPVAVPAKVDLTSPARWYTWTKNSIYVGSLDGFHQQGVDDAFGVKTLAGYSFTQYYPVASPPYDAVRIIASTAYGPAITPSFPANTGRVVFPNSGFQFGTPPAAAATVYAKFRTQLFQAQGYYLVQTATGGDDVTTYDMVSVADATTWISWEY